MLSLSVAQQYRYGL